MSLQKLPLTDSEAELAEFYAVARSNQQRGRWLRILLILAVALIVLVLLVGYTTSSSNEWRRPTRRDEQSQSPEYGREELAFSDRFIEFMERFDREYEDNEETMLRFKAYVKSMLAAEKLSKQGGAVFGETHFADWTDEEFKKMLLPKDFYKRLREKNTFIKHNPPRPERGEAPPPKTFDWREKGNYVTDVRDQHGCGSCWAFATTATVESAYAVAHGELRRLSEQTLLDCDLDDNACEGGDVDKAMRFVHRYGLAYRKDYPYKAKREECKADDLNRTQLTVSYFIHPDEDSIIDWLIHFGPVNIGISVPDGMKQYKEGVYEPTVDLCTNHVIGLHALMIVGYGEEEDSGKKWWMIKNSWNETWGMKGYVKFIRGINRCGSEDDPIGILA